MREGESTTLDFYPDAIGLRAVFTGSRQNWIMELKVHDIGPGGNLFH
jgi:hypothetical protein